jgi:lactoylglutathione lyase
MTLRPRSIDHINMSVKSLSETVDFYGKLFGFTVKKDQPEQASKIIGNDKILLCLYEDPALKVEEGINHFGFHVENFGEIEATCRKLGIPVLYGGPVTWEEKTRSLYVTDPSGYAIELSETPGGGL